MPQKEDFPNAECRYPTCMRYIKGHCIMRYCERDYGYAIRDYRDARRRFDEQARQQFETFN